MFKSFILIVAGAFSLAAEARSGGAIGGGEVTFKSVVTCRAESIDPTFPNLIKKVSVAAETDFDGEVVYDAPLTVVLLDHLDKAINYLPTVTLPGGFNPGSLKIYRWKQVLPGEPNPQLGVLRISGEQGTLSATSPDADFEDLTLSECIFEGNAQ